jgi:hypothetical protein
MLWPPDNTLIPKWFLTPPFPPLTYSVTWPWYPPFYQPTSGPPKNINHSFCHLDF